MSKRARELSVKISKLFDGEELMDVLKALEPAMAFAIVSAFPTRQEQLAALEIVAERILCYIEDLENEPQSYVH